MRRGGPAKENPKLREFVRTNDIVLVSAVGALLDGANIHHLVLDQNMSIIEGSLGVLPRRILVHEDDHREARQILVDAGLAHELRPEGQRRSNSPRMPFSVGNCVCDSRNRATAPAMTRCCWRLRHRHAWG